MLLHLRCEWRLNKVGPLLNVIWKTVGVTESIVCISSTAAGSKSTLKLMTNVPPGDGGKVEWGHSDLVSNSSVPKWHGGLGPLKSALQKNVRLCRAQSAVR